MAAPCAWAARKRSSTRYSDGASLGVCSPGVASSPGVYTRMRRVLEADFVAVALDEASRTADAKGLLQTWLEGDRTPRVLDVWVDGEPILKREFYATA